MAMVNVLKNLLHPCIIVEYDSTLGRVMMKEDGRGTKFKKMWIHGLHLTNTIAFRLDLNKPGYNVKSQFLNPVEPGIHRGCDYVIVTEVGGALHIVFCECKSNNLRGGPNQLYFSHVFWIYLSALADAVAEEKHQAVNKHFALFQTRPTLDKRPTTSRPLRPISHKGINVKVFGNPSRIHLNQML